MKLNYFDIHSHLNLTPLVENSDQIIAEMANLHIGTITVGVDYETSVRAIEFAHAHGHLLWATVGQHPNDNPEEKFVYEKFLELSKDDKVVSIGECGIDYYRLKGNPEEKELEVERQKNLFIEHIKLATETGLPLMIHARPHVGSQDAYHDALNILEENNFTGHANFHFFVGDLETAKRIVDKGWSVSYDGPITFSNEYDEVIKWIPMDNIMAETDAPFASPVPYRGQTNHPQYVEYVYKKIAEIKGLDGELVRKKLMENANRVFKLGFDN